jgi:ATP-binding cassette subfamily F protein 2
MVGTLEPVDGMVKRHNHLRIGQYHQHLTELLPMDMSPLDYMVGEATEGVSHEKGSCLVSGLDMCHWVGLQL